MAIGHRRPDEALPDAAGEPGEAALIERAKHGDDQAFSEIYRRYRDPMLRLALARLPDPRAAEEIVQETFLRALRRLDSVDSSRPLGPWLATIAANLVVDWHRSRDRLVPTERTEEILLSRSGADPTLDAVLASEGVRNLRAAIEMLPIRQRRILLASTIEELSPADVAQQENVSEASVTSVVYRARLGVRRALRRLTVVFLAYRAARDRLREHMPPALAGQLTLPAAEGAMSSVVLSLALLIASPPAHWKQQSLPAPPPSFSVAVVSTSSNVGPPRAPGLAPRGPSGTTPGLVRTGVDAKPPRDGAVTPPSTVMRIEVAGPDGQTLYYNETGVVCHDRVPEQPPGPVRIYC
jgi:RNA polymerase sigma-70 factor (ECF subfamily)